METRKYRRWDAPIGEYQDAGGRKMDNSAKCLIVKAKCLEMIPKVKRGIKLCEETGVWDRRQEFEKSLEYFEDMLYKAERGML